MLVELPLKQRGQETELGKIDPIGSEDRSHDALESINKGEPSNTVFRVPLANGEEGVNAAYLMSRRNPIRKWCFHMWNTPTKPMIMR
jgi:hypothetical protein